MMARRRRLAVLPERAALIEYLLSATISSSSSFAPLFAYSSDSWRDLVGHLINSRASCGDLRTSGAARQSGIALLKYFLTVGEEEQERRFRQRIDDPVRRGSSRRSTWSPTAASGTTPGLRRMLRLTDTPHAPWWIVDSDNKKAAHVNCLTHLLALDPLREGTSMTKSEARQAPEAPGRLGRPTGPPARSCCIGVPCRIIPTVVTDVQGFVTPVRPADHPLEPLRRCNRRRLMSRYSPATHTGKPRLGRRILAGWCSTRAPQCRSNSTLPSCIG